MASTSCNECSRSFDTGRDSYPFCSYDCKEQDALRKTRRTARVGDSDFPPPPARPSVVRGF